MVVTMAIIRLMACLRLGGEQKENTDQKTQIQSEWGDQSVGQYKHTQRESQSDGIGDGRGIDIAGAAVQCIGDQRDEQGFDAGFVTVHQKAEAPQVDQQGTVGQHTSVCQGFGLSAECQPHGLCFGTSPQQVGGMPDGIGTDKEKTQGLSPAPEHRPKASRTV